MLKHISRVRSMATMDDYVVYDGLLTKHPLPATQVVTGRSQHFPYKALDSNQAQIRLLKISDDAGDPYSQAREFRCQLVHKSLHETFDFSALSYAWGDCEDRPFSVLINWKSFNVTANLYAALLMLRRQGPGLYWIDAICINQDDPAEQNTQINLMRHIYGNAKMVHVWLGEAQHDTNLVEPFIRIFMRAYEKQHDAKDNRPFPRLTDRERRRYGYPARSDEGYAALDRFLTSPWCARVWIRQELALAKAYVFHRGRYAVKPGEILTLAASRINPTFNHPDVQVGRCLGDLMLVSLENTRVKSQKASKLLAILLRHRTALAKHPRDKVYGLLSFASDVVSGQTVIRPDVTKTFQAVYTDAATAIIKSQRSLDIFCAVDNDRLPPRDGLPSWVPDWRPRGVRGKTDTHIFREAEPGFEHIADFVSSATLDSTPQPRFDGPYLTIRAVLIDNLSNVGALMTQDDPLPPFPDWEMLAKARSKEKYRWTGDTRLDVYYETLTMGTCRGSSKQVRAMYKKYDETWRPMRKLLDRHIASIGINVMMREDEARDKLVTACRIDPLFYHISCALNRRLAETETDGLLVLAPATAAEGDCVVLCEGAKMPMVIRRHGNNYQLVGDCYVAGAMHGALWTTERKELLEEITLE